MHELTKILYDRTDYNKLIYDEAITKYMTEKAEWLKEQCTGSRVSINKDDLPEFNICKRIDQAFGLHKKTLQEKLKDWQIKNHRAFTSAEIFWEKYCKASVEIARQHYRDNPEELK